MTPTLTLHDWLTDLKRRNCHLTATGTVIHTEGLAATWNDHLHTRRYHHALLCAATGNWTTWWNHTTQRSTTVPNPDDIPHHHPDGPWSCACCGQPADRLDHLLLPWCNHHVPDYLTADLETA